MKKHFASLAACLLLAACAMPTLTPVRPGVGVVESVHRSAGDTPDMVYRTGGSYPTGYLIRVRMQDGSIQSVSQISGGFSKGDRVEITPEGKIVTLP